MKNVLYNYIKLKKDESYVLETGVPRDYLHSKRIKTAFREKIKNKFDLVFD